MAGPKIDNYSTASRKYANEMVKKNGVRKPDGSSTSTHSSRTQSDDGRKSKIASSMRKFLEDDDEFDYLGSLTNGKNRISSRDMSKQSTTSRKSRTPTSYRKKNGSDPRRPIIPRSSPKHKPLSIRKRSDTYEGSLNDEKPLSQSLMSSARKLVDTVKRAASPGRLRNRSNSPGPQKTRNSMRKSRSSSPTSSRTEVLTASPNSNSSGRNRSKSPGKLKKQVEENEESPKSTKSRKRSKSPGKLKSRSKSPGRMKARSKSPGVHRDRKDRPKRRPENASNHNDDSNHTSTSRRRARSTGPMRKPERAKSTDRTQARSRREGKASQSNQSSDGGDQPRKQESYSDMQDELNRYKVKRNKSMDTAMAMQARKAAQEISDDEDRNSPRRANSMMLSREKGRRGKSNSLADLVQYKEEEIHSTSYFASNHVLINRERMKRGLRPLTRNIAMDDLARKSAEAMAASGGVDVLQTTYVGNVLKGETIRTIHRSTMLQKQGRERANILNPYFQDFGVGTCKGTDGQLYMCQLFSERLELALTDTTKLEDASDQ